jgi:hypothetical protein
VPGVAPLALAAVLAGGTVPPLGAVLRAMWPRLVPASALPTAYALESVVVELCFVGGPLLVAGLTAASGPSAAVLAAGALTLVGTVLLVRTPVIRAITPVAASAPQLLGPLVSPPVRGLLLGVLAWAPASAPWRWPCPRSWRTSDAGPGPPACLLAVWSVGSIVGGLTYGAVHLPPRSDGSCRCSSPCSGVGTLLPLLVGGPLGGGMVMMSVALLGYGLAIAPFFACNSVLLGAAAPVGTVTEAFAWNSSMIFGGAALGSAAAGVLVERSGVVPALGVTALSGLVALLFSLRAVRRLPARVPV